MAQRPHQPADGPVDEAAVARYLQQQHEAAERQRLAARAATQRRLRRRLWVSGLLLVIVAVGLIAVLALAHVL